MKTNTSDKIARLAGFTLSIALLAGAIVTTVAGETPTGKGDATLLMKPQASVSAAARTAMSCPTCKDEYAIRKDLSARGTTKPVQLIERHLCPGCDTTLTAVGTGRAKQTVALHQCTSNSATEVACCKAQ
ncbi:MAG TPA: hypothetical protein VNZ64_22615 [Candidatus Acidoferrum sp.]|jgi:hypothetical protein|nr:hypothetical protein [Candidatus Acidoferrum sp.]